MSRQIQVGARRINQDGCRFGEFCPQPATHGRFGPTFCATHYRLLKDIDARPDSGPYRIRGTKGAEWEQEAA